jgi:hypothetical protein
MILETDQNIRNPKGYGEKNAKKNISVEILNL